MITSVSQSDQNISITSNDTIKVQVTEEIKENY